MEKNHYLDFKKNNMTDLSQTISKIKLIITDKMEYFEKYVKKDNPREFIVESLNLQIKYIITVYNFLI